MTIKGIKSLITIDDYRAELTAVNELLKKEIHPKRRKSLYRYSNKLKGEIAFYVKSFGKVQKT